MMARRRECVLLHIYKGDRMLGELMAVDVHGNGRGSNKAWMGTVDGIKVDLPNLKAVAVWAKAEGFEVDKRP